MPDNSNAITVKTEYSKVNIEKILIITWARVDIVQYRMKFVVNDFFSNYNL
jgi:hypothetical protein